MQKEVGAIRTFDCWISGEACRPRSRGWLARRSLTGSCPLIPLCSRLRSGPFSKVRVAPSFLGPFHCLARLDGLCLPHLVRSPDNCFSSGGPLHPLLQQMAHFFGL